MPTLFFNHPLQVESLVCPIDGASMIDTLFWTDGATNQDYKPRLIYDLTRNIYLVSKKYRCEMCKRLFVAHDRALQFQLKVAKLQLLVLKKSGVSFEFYSCVVNMSTTTGTIDNTIVTKRN